MKIFRALILAFLFGTFVPSGISHASPATDALAKCLADSTTGKDRKDLVRWFFTSLSVHPDIQHLASVSDTVRTDVDRVTAALLERLLTEACQEQAKAAIRVDGPDSMRLAFKALGELSAYELMGNPAVNAAIAGFTKHLNNEKLNAALK